MTQSKPEVRHPAVHSDKRGHHVKLFGKTPAQVDLPRLQVQEVFYTISNKNVVRGMHLQVNPAQPKLITCANGEFIAYTVCLMEGASYLTKEKHHLVSPERAQEADGAVASLWVPGGYALGYRSLKDNGRILYLAGSCYSPAGSFGVHPFSDLLGLDWSAPGETSTDFCSAKAVLSPADEELPEELRL